LATDDQRHLATERLEHVHELDAGDARADDDELLGNPRWRVRVARREDAVTVGHDPIGDPRAATRRQHDDVGAEFYEPVRGLSNDLVRALEGAAAADQPNILALQQFGDRTGEASLDRLHPLTQRTDIDHALGAVETHVVAVAHVAERAARCDHRFGRDAVP
jgi:hypothetical protein